LSEKISQKKNPMILLPPFQLNQNVIFDKLLWTQPFGLGLFGQLFIAGEMRQQYLDNNKK